MRMHGSIKSLAFGPVLNSFLNRARAQSVARSADKERFLFNIRNQRLSPLKPLFNRGNRMPPYRHNSGLAAFPQDRHCPVRKINITDVAAFDLGETQS